MATKKNEETTTTTEVNIVDTVETATNTDTEAKKETKKATQTTAVFISKIRSLKVKVDTGWVKFENGRVVVNSDTAILLRKAQTFGIDFWEETSK